jgi:hypothetical protein
MTVRRKINIGLSLAGLTIIAFACYKVQKINPAAETPAPAIHKEATIAAPAVPVFSKGVGRLVRKDTTRQWIDQYNHQVRENNTYVLSAQDLLPLLEYKDCVGILFYHAWDDAGWLVIPYGIREDGSLIKTDPLPGRSGSISWGRAAEYREVYKHRSNNKIEGHFFGTSILDTLIHKMGATTIRFQRGVNEKGEQLIMSNAGIINTGGEDYDVDASFSCPPMCPR